MSALCEPIAPSHHSRSGVIMKFVSSVSHDAFLQMNTEYLQRSLLVLIVRSHMLKAHYTIDSFVKT